MKIEEIKTVLKGQNGENVVSLSPRGIAIEAGIETTSENLNQIRHVCYEATERGELVCYQIVTENCDDVFFSVE